MAANTATGMLLEPSRQLLGLLRLSSSYMVTIGVSFFRVLRSYVCIQEEEMHKSVRELMYQGLWTNFAT